MNGIKKLFNNSLKEGFDIIPSLLTLGVITGYGAYTALFGALISSFFNISLILKGGLFGLCPQIALIFGAANSYLGGKSETLFALAFVCGFIVVFLSFMPKNCFRAEKSSSKGFLAGAFLSVAILCFPLVLNQKTYSSLNLMFSSLQDPLQNPLLYTADEFSIVISLLTAVIFYYIKKHIGKVFPASFLAVLGASAVSFIYKSNLISVNSGLENFKYPASADFGHLKILLPLSFVIAVVITSFCASSSSDSFKKTSVLSGLSNMIAATGGLISGGIKPIGGKKRNFIFTEFFTLLIFCLFFNKISIYIPLCACASILMFESAVYSYKSLTGQKNKNIKSKIIFTLCFLTTFYNIILSACFCMAFSLYERIKYVKKN